MDADVTFNAVEVKLIDLAVLSADAERRAQQAQMQSDAYKLQRTALTALETKVKDRLAKVQVAEGSKASK